MLFSIVIPTFNRAALLARTLESVWAQRCTDFEVIVVDDGSTDGTGDFVRGLGARVQLFTQSNSGPGAGRNFGAQHARGEYLAFLDSDDLWFPWTLETFAGLIRDCSKPSILAAGLMSFENEEGLAVVKRAETRGEYFADYLASHRRHYFVGAGMSVLRRDCFLSTGGFTDKRINAEDHDLILRMGTAPGFVQVCEPVTLAWRRHAGSATMDDRRAFEGSLYLVEQERRQAYPGGATRGQERWDIVTSRVRPTSLQCLQRGLRRESWKLYRATFGWHLRLGRWKFLAGFPFLAALTLLRRRD